MHSREGPERSGIVVDLPGHEAPPHGAGREVAIFSHGPNAMSLFDLEGKILDVNEAWCTLYGYSREEARSMTVRDVSAEPDVTRETMRKAEVSGGALVPLRWHKKRDGTVFPVELTSGTLCIGDLRLMYAVMHDITERLRVETDLQRSEARFRALTESLPVGLAVHRGGRVLYANPAIRTMLGIPPEEELVGSSPMRWVHPDDHATVGERVALLQNGAPSVPFAEERLIRRDGTTLWVEAFGMPIDFDGEPAVLTLARDVDERKQLQAQLVLADRLASLGRLAASVGHEINNPLAYVLATIELLRRDVSRIAGIDQKTRQELLERITVLEDGTVRVRDIVRDLKALSVGETTTPPPYTEVHRVLDVSANMATHALPRGATLVRDYGSPVRVRVTEARLGQVFLNLLLNAAQSIAVEEPEATNEVRVTTRRIDGDRVTIEVSDTGVGIPPDVRDHIFEPFFTTKGVTGTGLGLSISHTIVTSVGGTIAVEPNSPRGSRFIVTLPCEPTG